MEYHEETQGINSVVASSMDRDAASQEEEIDFVSAFMTSLTQGMCRDKEDEVQIRRRKERKKEINRASAKRKRARAKQDLDNMANQCQQLEVETRQLRSDNVRLTAVIRDEMEKQRIYISQVEYIKTALLQQGGQQNQATAPHSSQPDVSEGAIADAALIPGTSTEGPAPLVVVAPSTLLSSTARPSSPVEQLRRAPSPSDGSQGAPLLRMFSQLQQSCTNAPTEGHQSQPLDPCSQQQLCQGLANLLGVASLSASQNTANPAAMVAPPALVYDPQSVSNQETLNQLQMLLSALISVSVVPPVGTSSSDETADPGSLSMVAPSPTATPLQQANMETAQQLQGFLVALATATAGALPSGATAHEGQTGATEQSRNPLSSETSGELVPPPARASS